MTEPTSRPPVPRAAPPAAARRRSLGERLVGAVRSLFRIVELTARVIISLAVLALVAWLVALALSSDEPEIGDSTALVLAPNGFLVEQLTGYPAERLLLEFLGQPVEPETLVRPMLDAVERAAGDDRVKVLVLDLNRLAGGGLTKLEDLGRAIDRFRESGKPVVALSDFYFQPHYYLAARADEVFVNPMGIVLLQGYGSYRRYYKEALDEIEARWNVFRVGEYKSAVEPFIRNDMSPEAREARLEWLSDLWSSYRRDVAAARTLDESVVERYAAEYPARLAEYGGDAARLALEAGLVDRVAPRDEVRARLIELAGEDEESGSFNQIGHASYLAATEAPEREGEGVVAVVVARGSIVDGSQPPGAIGGDSTARLIRDAREDEEVEALVLRVDSPGGSAFAAEIIRREIELTRAAGKPVVASMGSVAASGGYWISMTADQIWASETTITGSIGIYAMIPTFEQSLLKLGIHNDGVGTHPMAGVGSLDRDLPQEVFDTVRLLIEQGYEDFITKAAAGRRMEVAELDRIARGRVWSGEDARRLGLVDELGDLEDAIAAAATLAELGEEYRIRYVEEPPSRRQQLMSWLLGRSEPWLRAALPRPGRPRPTDHPMLRTLADDLSLLGAGQPPLATLAYCFCDYR